MELIDRKNKIIIDWSAKAGCTGVIEMFFRHMGILREHCKESDGSLHYGPWVHHYRENTFSKNKNNRVTEKDLMRADYFKIKFVRNPYSRVVSSYIHAMKYGYENENIMKILKINKSDISFNQFVNYLQNIDIRNSNIHHRLQKKRYEYSIPNVFNFIVKIEKMKEDIKTLNKIGNFNFDTTDLSSIHHIKKQSIEGEVCSKPWSEIKDSIPHYGRFYNADLIRKVYEVYKDDITTYKYSFDI